MARWWRRGDADPALPQSHSVNKVALPAPPSVQRAAWRDLPPLRPTLISTPPVAPRDSFTASLATSHNPSFLAPLGHVVDPDGPSGHVQGLASPVAPQVISTGPDLPVAQRQVSSSSSSTPSSASSIVQRLLTPKIWFSDTADRTATAAPTQSEPIFSIPEEQAPLAAEDHPRHLDATSPTTSHPSFTSAPDQDVARSLPVVAAPPSSAAAAPAATVSRHIANDHEHAGAVPDQQSAPEPAAPELAAPETVAPETAAADSAPPIAPLLGDIGQSTDEQTTSGPGYHAGSESSMSAPGPLAAATVQRSTADTPVRRPGLGAPLAAPAVPSTSALTSPNIPAVQRVPVPRDLLSGSPSASSNPPRGRRSPEPPGAAPPVQRSVAVDPNEHSDVHRHAEQTDEAAASSTTGNTPDVPVLGLSALMRAPDPAAPAHAAASSGDTESAGSYAPPTIAGPSSPAVQRASRPRGLGAPLSIGAPASLGESPMAVQRHMDSAGSGFGPHSPTSSDSQRSAAAAAAQSSIADAPTVGHADPLATPTAPLLEYSETSSATGPSPSDTAASVAMHMAEVHVPTSVQRAFDVASPTTVGPWAATSSYDGGSQSGSAADGGDHLDTPFPAAVAPLLGDSTDPLGTAAPSSTGVSSQPSAGAVPGANVQRAASASGAGTPIHRTPTPSTGFGAPISAVPSTVAAGDRIVTAREMPLQRMFEPGVAAIASGAAYSDGGNSVVFRPPMPNPPLPNPPTPNPPVIDAPTSPPTTSTARPELPMANLPVARSAMAPLAMPSSPPTNPTLGSFFGGDQAVQRFGLPSVSSLTSSARNAVGGVADTARQAAGNYADTARNTASGYLNQAGGAAGNAASTAGGYLDSARSAAGDYADSAAGAAGGYLASARNAVGGVADQAAGMSDQAGAAVGNAASAAQGAVGGAVDTVSNAASGVQAAAGDAASGAAGAVAGAAGAAAGALPTDLDELARRLFDPLSARFKSELWLDRERAGMVTDLRR